MQTNVGELINLDVVNGSNLTVTLTEVKRNLNLGYKKCINALVATNQSMFLRLSKANLVDDQESYALPTDFRKLERLEIGYTSDVTRSKASRIDRNAINDPNSTFSSAAPIFALVDAGIEIFPTPTDNVSNGLWLWYIENPSDLSADSDTSRLPFGFEDLPVLYSVSKAKRRLGLVAEADEALAEFNGEVQRMVELNTPRAEDSNEFVQVREYISEY